MSARTYRALLPAGFETSEEAASRSRRLVRQLRIRDHERLADKLLSCTKADPCQSGACPDCLREFRVTLLREGVQVLEKHRHWTRASIIPEDFAFPAGQLSQLSIEAMTRMIRKRLERHCDRSVKIIGGLDVSFNTDENQSGLWQWHVYVLVSSRLTEDLRADLAGAFPPEMGPKRSHYLSALYSHRRPLTYCFKSAFYRRSSYADENGHRQKIDQALSANQEAELALALDAAPLGSRLILKGLKRSSGRNWHLLDLSSR